MKKITESAFDSEAKWPADGRRPKIAFFDYPDVFEDFYPHYGVDQHSFGTTWQNTANHAWLKLVQRHVGDVTWFVTCLKTDLTESFHQTIGCQVRFYPSSWLHRQLWRLFYGPSMAWRWRSYYRLYAVIASYLAPLSWPLWRGLVSLRPDVLFVQDYCSGRYDVLLLVSKLLKIPLITFHSGSTEEKYLGKAMKSFTIPRAAVLFPSGKSEMSRLQNRYGISSSRLFILRPPLDATVFSILDRTTCCEHFGLDRKRRYLLFFGRLDDSVKRISSIICQFSLLAEDFQDFDLVIAGSGRDHAELVGLSNRILPGRVHFMGWIAEDQRKAMLYNTADCMVLASWREASPAVIGEAFACGTPVVSSDVGGISDLVKDDVSGWLFPAGDDDSLLRCLSKVMSNAGQIAAMRPLVREMATKLVSNEVVGETLKNGFDSVMGNK